MIKDNKVLLIPDVHIPYHDKKAFALMIKAGTEFKPNTIIVMGDLIDNYSISRYEKDPTRERFLKWEVAEANKGLDAICRISPQARKVFLAGNHEERLDTYIKKEAPQLFGLVDTATLLNLKKRGFSYHPYGKHIKIGKLIATHGTLTRKGIARVMIDKYGKSVAFGHVHKIEQSIKVNALGEGHVGFTMGWLGDIKKTDYIKDFTDWTLGFATAIILPNGNFFHQVHPIVNYKCWANGKIYEG
jgi:predicted phosphodiesterase